MIDRTVKPTFFYRNGVACAVSCTREGAHWGHVGVEPTNRHHGSRYVLAGGVSLYRVVPQIANDVLLRKWWLGFEGSRPYRYDATLAEVMAAADAIGRDEP